MPAQYLHRPEHIKTFGFANLTSMRYIITLQHIWFTSSFLLIMHPNTYMIWRYASSPGTLQTLPTTTWEINWYELEIAFMFHQRSMWMKFCAIIGRHMVTLRSSYSLWGSSNTLSWMVIHSWIRKSTRISCKLLGYVNVWLFQAYLTCHIMSLCWVGSWMNLG